jgi:hypothetical protein
LGAGNHDQVAIRLDPGFAMPHLHLGLLARRAGNRAAARDELGQALLLLQREDRARCSCLAAGSPVKRSSRSVARSCWNLAGRHERRRAPRE